MRRGRAVAGVIAVGSALLVATASAPLSACCQAACGSEATLIVHAGPQTSPVGTVNASLGGTDVAVEVDDTAVAFSCKVTAGDATCEFTNGVLTINMDLESYREPQAVLDVTVSEGGTTARFEAPMELQPHQICGDTCYGLVSPVELWVGGTA